MIEFRQAKLPDELEYLYQFDQRIFADYPGDLFTLEDWREFDSYWMLEEGQVVGCAAFHPNVDYDLTHRPGCIHIVSTGILPEYRGRGLGRKQKEWEIKHARAHGFQVIVTNMRRSNERMIRLNEQFGFRLRLIDPGYYHDPPEDALVMELRL
jgi:ribosomal protein S18 acetylase RimI-like enzyme